MGATIGIPFDLNSSQFLDSRQGEPKSKTDLKNWKKDVPEGFEVCLDGTWYFYDSTVTLNETGHWVPRLATELNDSSRSGVSVGVLNEIINEYNERIGEMETKIETLEDSIYVTTFKTLIAGSYYNSTSSTVVQTDKTEYLNELNTHLSNGTYDNWYDLNDDGEITTEDKTLANTLFTNISNSLSYNTTGESSTYILPVGSYVLPRISWTINRKGATVSPIKAEVSGDGMVEESQALFKGRKALTSNVPKTYSYKVTAYAKTVSYAEDYVYFKFKYQYLVGAGNSSIWASGSLKQSDLSEWVTGWADDTTVPTTSVNCAGGKYPYILVPVDYYSEDCRIYLDGAESTSLFESKAVTLTNIRGISIRYRLFRTTDLQNNVATTIRIIP